MSEVRATKRRRGRPRGGAGDTRERILSAATAEFAEAGYDGATMRAIAARADVDAALVHHYFGTKADLFGATIDTPIRPDIAIRTLLNGPLEDLGERIVRFVLDSWEQADVRRRGLVLLRAGLSSRATAPVLAGFLARELLERIADRVGTPDAALRASLAASQIAGLLVTRYILRLPAMRAASVDDLVAWLAPTVQRYLTGDQTPS
ncbi:TetR/AcrR family transcriptional regulator [Microbacterium protaetiae]|uniref:TetR/AcrR family transcriptional regulator n=1 Tax=Microbacterium protaetiae TaxID=2509458 RepID=A0A4V0YDD5_9MICO|nr:TetR family transcriptional regulator [Microbacterium protaetiae]QAY60331.1 TetR/AcrR family transcriptional regulator [Microbacterium protaetiae]